MKKMIAKAVIWFTWFPLKSTLKRLPWKFNYALAHFASGFFYLSSKRRRDIVGEEVAKLYGSGDTGNLSEKNVAPGFIPGQLTGDKHRFIPGQISGGQAPALRGRIDIDRIVRNSFDIFTKRQAENFLLGDLTREQLDRLTTIEGIGHLDAALQKGNGVILLLSHFGSFLLPLPVLGYRGYKVTQIGGRPLIEGEDNSVKKMIFELRKRDADKMPVRFILVDKYLGPIVKTLKNNEIVAIAFDGRTGNKWIPVRLFDRTAQFSPGPFNLALKTGAAILPTFVVRDRHNRHKIIIEPAFKIEATDDTEESLKRDMQNYTKIFEKYLVNYPCHFGMTLYTIRNEAARGLNRPLFVD